MKYIDSLQKRIVNNLDSDTLAKLNLQIDRLFRKVDADQSGYVEIKELHNLLKPLRPGKLSMADCE